MKKKTPTKIGPHPTTFPVHGDKDYDNNHQPPPPLNPHLPSSLKRNHHRHHTPTPAMAPPHPLRIAILECDTGLPQALAKYKRYGAISSALLEAGAAAAAGVSGLSSLPQQQQEEEEQQQEERGEEEELQQRQEGGKRGLEIGIWDVVNEAGRFPRLEDVDGVFLTGSSM